MLDLSLEYGIVVNRRRVKHMNLHINNSFAIYIYQDLHVYMWE